MALDHMESQNEPGLEEQYNSMRLRNRAVHHGNPLRLQMRSEAARLKAAQSVPHAQAEQATQGEQATSTMPMPTPREQNHPAPPTMPMPTTPREQDNPAPPQAPDVKTTTGATDLNGEASKNRGMMEIDEAEIVPPQAGNPNIDNTEILPPPVGKPAVVEATATVKKERCIENEGGDVRAGATQGSNRLSKLGEDLKAIKAAILRLEVEVHDARAERDGEDCFADDEGDDDNSPSNSKKINTGKHSKLAWINKLQRDIRFHTMFLMDRKDCTDPLPDSPSLEDVKKLKEGDETVGPSRVNFVVDLCATSASRWNKKVIQIFAQDFLASGWYKCKKKEEIKKGFKTHLDSLIREYKQSQKDTNDAALARRQDAARRRRKLQLYYRRLRSAKVHPDLRCHASALQELGVDGMSSDDSCWEEGRPIYNIRKKKWRSAAVKLWLRDMDAVHLSLRATSTGRAMRGNWPHEQWDTAILSSRKPVKRLPINFYSTDWLSSLPPERIEDLDHCKEPHDLTHSQNVTSIASMWRGVHHPSMAPK